MKKAVMIMSALMAVALFGGCGGQQALTGRSSIINSYLIPDINVGGDYATELPAVESIVVWPIENVAAGSKAKGVELVLKDYLIDNLYLDNTFKSVFILSEGDEKDLVGRVGEELGLKKKPKEPIESALVLTKIGQLTGTEAVLIGRLDDYDEVKVDKASYSTVGVSFFLFDAREKSYPSLDSFTPAKTLWRSNAIRRAKETAFLSRPTLHETARVLINQLVQRLERDLGRGRAEARQALDKRIGELEAQASRQLAAEEFDEAVASWNEILKLDPENSRAAGAIEGIEAAKVEAAKRAELEKLREQIAGFKEKALGLEEGGDLNGALGEWNKVLELDAENAEASEKVRTLNDAIAAAQVVEQEQEIAKNLHLSQQALGESRYAEAAELAKKVLALDSTNAKAQSLLEAAELKLEEARAAEERAAPTPEVEVTPVEEAQPEEPAPAAEEEAVEVEEAVEEEAAVEEAAPAAEAPGPTSEIEQLRSQAMEYFNGEEYEKAEEAWKKLLEAAPDDKQALEMLETTQMLIEALK